MQDPGNGAVSCPCGCGGFTSPGHAAEIQALRAERPGTKHTPEQVAEMTAAVAAVQPAPETAPEPVTRPAVMSEHDAVVAALHARPDMVPGLGTTSRGYAVEGDHGEYEENLRRATFR